jgi:hypothetical protein
VASWIHADPWTHVARWILVGLWTLAALSIPGDLWIPVASLTLGVLSTHAIRTVTCMDCPAAMPSAPSVV